MDKDTKAANTGGLYKNVKVPVKTVNIVIAVGIAALVLVLIFVTCNNGFKVEFDTDGGSHIDPVIGYYGELLTEPTAPVKEGFTFAGWSLDRDGTMVWDFGADTPDGDLTLYAIWVEKPQD